MTAPYPRPQRRSVPLIVRDANAGTHVELFLVTAVATVLAIRGFLALTGYPQLGGRGLHVAHMLWGGLGLGAALILDLLSLNRRVKPVAALLGGLSFGFFIDELGKLITRDNDYFYQPTIALMYFIFVVFFLATRRLLSRNAFTTDEHLANAIALMKDMALQDLDAQEKARAAAFLDRCDPHDPRAAVLREFLDRLATVSPPPPAWHQRLRRWTTARIEGMLSRPAFPRVLSLFFVAQALIAIVWATLAARVLWIGWRSPVESVHIELGFMHWARLVSALASTVFVVNGSARLLRSPLRAYQSFRMSLLIAVFVTQFFVFYDAQLVGVFGLAFNLGLLGSVQYLIARERRRETQPPAATAPPSQAAADTGR